MDIVVISPAVALGYWREGRMPIERVMSQTGYQRFSDLYEAYTEMMENEAAAQQNMAATQQQCDLSDDRSEVWSVYGSYLREFVSPPEYGEEVDRLVPIIRVERQAVNAAASKSFGRQ